MSKCKFWTLEQTEPGPWCETHSNYNCQGPAPDLRALVADLADALDYYAERDPDPDRTYHDLNARARAVVKGESK